jgi:hypothetical protein
MLKTTIIVLATVLLASPQSPSAVDPNLAVRTVISGLDQPTTMAFVGPNDFLVLKKSTGRDLAVIRRGTGRDAGNLAEDCLECTMADVPGLGEGSKWSRCFEHGDEISEVRDIAWIAFIGVRGASIAERPGLTMGIESGPEKEWQR